MGTPGEAVVTHLEWTYPWMLAFILLVPLIGWLGWRSLSRAPRLGVPEDLSDLPKSWRVRFRETPLCLRLLAVTCLIAAMAMPMRVKAVEDVTTWGVDMMLLLDVSTSMQVRDVKPDRIGAARAIMHQFILGRPHDRMGLIAFAAWPLLRCPLVADREMLAAIVDSTNNLGFEDGTAIGDALLSAAVRLQRSRAHSRVVVLLTDGASNMGSVDPVTAARALAAKNIRVYTIGVGKNGTYEGDFVLPNGQKTHGQVESQLDEASLAQIARITGGHYWHADDRGAIEAAYRSIDRMEKSKVEAKRYYERTPAQAPWLWAAFLFLASSILLERTAFRRLP